MKFLTIFYPLTVSKEKPDQLYVYMTYYIEVFYYLIRVRLLRVGVAGDPGLHISSALPMIHNDM